MKKFSLKTYYHQLVVILLFLILLSPIFATFLYSISTSWGATLLPDGLTLDWYWKLWSDERFLASLWRSLWICFASVFIAILFTFPVIFVTNYYFPRLKLLMNLVIILPFAVPPVVSSVGLLQLYADDPLPLTGTPWILIGCYFMIALPFIYRSIENNIQALNIRDLVDTSRLLGSSTVMAILKVILPNLRDGMLSAIFLSFSFLIGEFLFANMLVGGQYETLQVYLFNIRFKGGHYSSALVISYFLLILFATLIANRFSKK
ncbi:ABC transporter permease [Pelistega europaea]|uniref:ABC transporter permease n=1 Tax=Pelistega europaea TaxID=106147 RepID=A0A7Y4P340_9BURK|nr:ABC transporter permease [Pelistega europaea]NOL48627.1 ABC transporter permease [Pelistega europaea]